MKNKAVLNQLTYWNGGTIEEVKALLRQENPVKHIQRLRVVRSDTEPIGKYKVAVKNGNGYLIAVSPYFETAGESIDFYNGLLETCGSDLRSKIRCEDLIDWAKWQLIGRVDWLGEDIEIYRDLADNENWN